MTVKVLDKVRLVGAAAVAYGTREGVVDDVDDHPGTNLEVAITVKLDDALGREYAYVSEEEVEVLS